MSVCTGIESVQTLLDLRLWCDIHMKTFVSLCRPLWLCQNGFDAKIHFCIQFVNKMFNKMFSNTTVDLEL